jgi:hypothetical protein
MGQKRAYLRTLSKKMKREKWLVALVSASRLRSRLRLRLSEVLIRTEP